MLLLWVVSFYALPRQLDVYYESFMLKKSVNRKKKNHQSPYPVATSIHLKIGELYSSEKMLECKEQMTTR